LRKILCLNNLLKNVAKNNGKKLLEKSIDTWDTIKDKGSNAVSDGLTSFRLISSVTNGPLKKTCSYWSANK